MDCRARLHPPVDDDYFGNCLRPVHTIILVRDLIAQDSLANACAAIHKSIDDVPKDLLSDCENWVDDMKGNRHDRLITASGYPKFRIYEVDFGWGEPDRCEMVSMNRNGMFGLVAGKKEGTVQVLVSLDPNQMEAFAKLFLGGME